MTTSIYRRRRRLAKKLRLKKGLLTRDEKFLRECERGGHYSNADLDEILQEEDELILAAVELFKKDRPQEANELEEGLMRGTVSKEHAAGLITDHWKKADGYTKWLRQKET